MAQAEALRDRGSRYCSSSTVWRALPPRATSPWRRGNRWAAPAPPSVVGRQARLERAGPTRSGSITLIATVLTEGPLEHDPIADEARAALDGHLVLAPRLATAGWYPAIEVPASASRTAADVVEPAHLAAAGALRAAVAALDASREARGFGLEPERTDPALARAVAAEAAIAAFLRQGPEPSAPDATLAALAARLHTADRGPGRGRHRGCRILMPMMHRADMIDDGSFH